MPDYDVLDRVISQTGPELDEVEPTILTDKIRKEWIAILPRELIPDFSSLYVWAKLTDDFVLGDWLDTQLMLRASVDGRRSKQLIEMAKVQVLQHGWQEGNFTAHPNVAEQPRKKKGLFR